MVSPENNPNWMFDCGLLDDVYVPGGDLPSLNHGFQWPTNAFPPPPPPVLRFVFVVFFFYLSISRFDFFVSFIVI